MLRSLFLRNLIFTILQPGVVAGLVPLLILGEGAKILSPASWKIPQYVGSLLFVCGLILMISCISRFALEGKGTLSPLDPTKKLVTNGLYKFSRNPMYVGVMLMLVGEAIYFQSAYLWFYLLLVFWAFHTFIILREEPRLKNEFGEEYIIYSQKVRRWI